MTIKRARVEAFIWGVIVGAAVISLPWNDHHVTHHTEDLTDCGEIDRYVEPQVIWKSLDDGCYITIDPYERVCEVDNGTDWMRAGGI